jgi:hypothetical protein
MTNITTDSTQKKLRLLFLSADSFCYDSARSFQRSITRELRRRGMEVTELSCPKERAFTVLREIYGQDYDMILDINSVLPAAKDEDGEFCLNHIHGAVWHYILDHPLYHHEVLQCPLQDFSVICLDENHAAFIRRHYPHIKHVLCLPLGAEQSETLIPYDKRTHDVLFTGTYTDSQALLYKATKLPSSERRLFEQVVQLLLEKPCLTQEEAMSIFWDSDDLEENVLSHFSDSDELRDNSLSGFSDNRGLGFLLQNRMVFVLADMYLRACTREEALFQTLGRGIPVTVYGHGWEQFAANCKDKIPHVKKLLQIKGEVSYEELPKIYADTKIAWNILPWFKAGMHDRIPMAMMNGCVCVTDENDYLEHHFLEGEQLYFYSLEDMENMTDTVLALLKNPSAAAKTAAKGYRYALKHLSWKHWTDVFTETALMKQ